MRPLPTASIGMIEFISSSSTYAASSTIMRSGAEKPRALSLLPGSDLMRLPFVNVHDVMLSPSITGGFGMLLNTAAAFRNSSAVCTSVGEKRSVRLRGL